MTGYTKRILIYLMMCVLYLPIRGKEFIHVFTNKGIYETSEDLWFKCIAIDDSTMRISDRTQTAYVEIINPSDSVVWMEKYRMSNGMCDGHVYVGDDWKPGEYRMFVHTRNSLGLGDTIVYPKRLLVVRDLPEIPGFLSHAQELTHYIDMPDTTETSRLKVTVTPDSAEYHAGSKVKATVKVSDADGKPVRVIIAMSVSDALYSYPPAEIDIESNIYGITHDTARALNRGSEPFLSNGVVSGYLRSGRKNNTVTLEGQYINVFDDIAEKGAVNIISTGKAGSFEVSPNIGSSLGKTLMIRPLADESIKPKLELDEPFRDIAKIQKEAIEKDYPIIRNYTLQNEKTDTADYSGRRILRLDEVLVEGKNKNFSSRKKNKLLGYLDSLAISRGSAWVCCGEIINGEYVGGFLNDYIPGYNHHPLDDPYYSYTPPKNISIPERGKLYRMIKMTWNQRLQCYDYEHEAWTTYAGPYYTDEDLLSMEGIYKARGYYPKHRFRLPDEDDLIPGIEDCRNALLWIPRAQTDENGEFTIEFPTSDIRSTFKISVLILTPDVRDAKNINEYFIVK